MNLLVFLLSAIFAVTVLVACKCGVIDDPAIILSYVQSPLLHSHLNSITKLKCFSFHTTPNILHYRNNEPNGQMAEGHTFTIEPMICEGSAKVLNWPDDWTATSE